MSKKRGFTLIEMLVTVAIVVILTSLSVVNFSQATSGSSVVTTAGDIKGLFNRLKSFGYGPNQARIYHYVLIIQTNDPVNGNEVCNRGGVNPPNKLFKNQYMVCSTSEKDISSFGPAELNSEFNRVFGGNLKTDISITSQIFGNFNGAIAINIRTLDAQTGYDLRYCDQSNSCGTPTITLTQGDINQTLTFESVIGTLK